MARERQLHTVEMTTGSLWKNILLFSLPLMLTQILEVLFNLSDVAIAGKFADYRALGAVGSTTLLVSLFTGLLIGIGSGVNVAVARGLGLRNREQVENTIHSSFLICAVNESPAPTPSATSTCGVATYDMPSGVNTWLPTAPQVSITVRSPYFSSRSRHCACMPNIRLTTVNSSSFVFRILLRQSESWTTSGE